MEFERETNKIQPAERKDFFERPFDDEKIRMVVGELLNKTKMEENRVIYKEEVSKELEYVVASNGPVASFYIKNQTGEILADFKFKSIENRLSLEHRDINEHLREYDINGSMFLLKNERFLKQLVEIGGKKEIEGFLIDSGQKGVINWALKNGYSFKNSEQEELYNKIINGKTNDYVMTNEFKKGNNYQGYIFKKDNLQKTRAYFKEQTEKGEDRENIDLRGFSERFELEKEL